MIYANLIAMFDCRVNDEDLDAGDFPLPPCLKHRTCASKWARFRCKLSNSNRNRAARPRLKKMEGSTNQIISDWSKFQCGKPGKPDAINHP